MHLVSVHSSPNDRMLWAVDSKGNVHVRTGITEDMPVGTDWEHIPGTVFTSKGLRGNTRVWNGHTDRPASYLLLFLPGFLCLFLKKG